MTARLHLVALPTRMVSFQRLKRELSIEPFWPSVVNLPLGEQELT